MSLLGLAYILVGGKMMADGLSKLRGTSVAGLVGTRAGTGLIKRTDTYKVENIDERVGLIRNLILEGSAESEIKEAALDVLTKKCGPRGSEDWCSPVRDYPSEVTALFNAVRDPRSPIALRYTRDHATIDQFTSAKKLLKIRGADCDDMCVLLGSLLMAVGYRVRLVVIQAKGASSWSHIYLEVAADPTTGKGAWIALDPTVNQPAGWAAPDEIVVRRKRYAV